MPSFAQDPEDPTGIRDETPRGNKEVARARDRKGASALQLRIAHAEWDEIAEVLGYPNGGAAQVAAELALAKQLDTESREKMRQMVGQRLNRMNRAIWPKVIDEKNPDQLAAQREARANMADFSRLYGLNAPTEMVVHSPTAEELERWVYAVVSKTVPQLEEGNVFEDGETIEGEVIADEETG